MADTRDDFERFVSQLRTGYTFDRSAGGAYVSEKIDLMWSAWQAAITGRRFDNVERIAERAAEMRRLVASSASSASVSPNLLEELLTLLGYPSTLADLGRPLAEAGLDGLRIRAPDGTLSRIEGLVVPTGSTIREALEDFCLKQPGYAIVTAPSIEQRRVMLELAVMGWLEACNNDVPAVTGMTSLDYTATDLEVTITIKAPLINRPRFPR